MSSSKFVRSIIGNSSKKKEKFEAYTHLQSDWRFNVSRLLLTGVFKNQFYRSIDSAVDEALKLAPYAAKTDPTFLLKAACFARDVNMKGMVKVAVAALACNADEAFLNKPAAKSAIIGLLSTFHPGQLLQFIELVKSKKLGKGLGSRSQKWVRSVMESWKDDKVEYYTLKYPTALNSLVRIVHPRYTDERSKLVKYILKDGKAYGTRQKAAERAKDITSGTEMAKLMLDENIPWDAIKGISINQNEDFHLARMVQMELSALLLNMSSLENSGIFNTARGKEALALKMQEVKSGRALPIDFAKPYIHCSSNPVKNTLIEAMGDTLDVPMPSLESKSIALTIDVSGSMNGETLKTAGLLAIPFVKSKNLWFTTFDTFLYEEGSSYCPKISGLNRKTQIERLLSLRANGGTNISLALNKAIQDKKVFDLFIVVTDEQQNTGTPLMSAWRKYKAINPKAELWIVNATNYEWTACDYNDPSVTVYHGLTPGIFKNLEFAGMDLVSAIDNYDLSSKRKKFIQNELSK